MRYIQSFASSGDVQTAIDNNLLGNPYVAYVEDGQHLDWNSLAPTPQVETRIKNTYRITEEDWGQMSGETEEYRKFSVSFYGPEFGVEKVELEDGTEIEYEEGSGYNATATGAGDYVVYITVSGDTIGGTGVQDPYEGLFAALSWLVSSEIPVSINTLEFGAYTGSAIESAVLPNHPMTFGVGCFGATQLSSINNGQNLIPAGSVVESWAFYDTQLDHITIGSGVTFPQTDGSPSQFMGPLTSVTFLDPVPPVIYPSIDSDVPGTFPWENIQEIHVPVGYEQAYVTAFNTYLDGEYTFTVTGTGEISTTQEG